MKPDETHGMVDGMGSPEGRPEEPGHPEQPEGPPERPAREAEASGGDGARDAAKPDGSGGVATWADQLIAQSQQAFAKVGRDAQNELRKPTTGAAAAGAAVVAAAAILGLPEAALGAAAAYVVYRILKHNKKD